MSVEIGPCRFPFDIAPFDPKAAPASRPPREGWAAFDDGWSRYSNPYPAGTRESDEWGWAWAEAEGHYQAQRELAGGADPEDHK